MRSSLCATFVFIFLFSACSGPLSMHDEGEPLDSIELSQPMRTGGELIDPVHGKETTLWYGAVAGANGENANGVAFVHLFEDGVSVVTAQVNILPAPTGAVFHVRMTDETGARSVDIGPLESITGDARHAVKGETTEDLSSLLRLVVVRVQGTSETVVAEGVLKLPSKAQGISE